MDHLNDTHALQQTWISGLTPGSGGLRNMVESSGPCHPVAHQSRWSIPTVAPTPKPEALFSGALRSEFGRGTRNVATTWSGESHLSN